MAATCKGTSAPLRDDIGVFRTHHAKPRQRNFGLHRKGHTRLQLLLKALSDGRCLYLPKESKWNPFVLWDRQQNSAGYTGGSDFSALLGKQGVALTKLRPAGTVLIEGRRYDVSSMGDFLPKDSKIVVTKVEGNKLFVDLVKE